MTDINCIMSRKSSDNDNNINRMSATHAAYKLSDRLTQVATNLIESDTTHEFVYKRPRLLDFQMYQSNATLPISQFSTASLPAERGESDETEFDWLRIGNFEFSEAVYQLHEYIAQWQLTPATKFSLVPKKEVEMVPLQGKRYFVDAYFSKPTPSCPNPLAIAKVHFYINVSSVLPKFYPIMVTYRFEGYKTMYYAVGERALRSLSFQRSYIDTILHMKLRCYVEIHNCFHPDRLNKEKKEQQYDVQILS